MEFEKLTFDPDSPLSWEQQMDKQFGVLLKRKIAQEKVQRGRDQVSHGELRANTVKAFLAAFKPEKAVEIEKAITKLRTIKGDKKFKAETIRMLMEMYLLGLYQAYLKPDVVAEALKLHEAKKEK
jgi:hypothetical protein